MATHSSVLGLGKSHGQRSLVGYSPWGCKESDKTEATSYEFHLFYNLVNSLYIHISNIFKLFIYLAALGLCSYAQAFSNGGD